MANLILGFDCGGTKTQVDVVCCDKKQKKVIESFLVDGMNVNSYGEEKVLEHLAEAFDRIGASRLTEVKAIGFGAAGVSNPLTREVFFQGVRNAGCLVEPLLIGDHQAALWGAHADGNGIILIAGTGSVCCGHIHDVNGWTETRCGGYGHLIDDEGSGYTLGRDVLSAVVRAEDGRISPTVMRKAVFEKLKINSIQELIGFVYSKDTGKKEIAALAPILELGVVAEERVALEILQKAADNLAAMVFPVADKLGLSNGPLSFCGSVLKKNARIRTLTTQKIQEKLPEIRICPPQYDAAYGAALAAMQEKLIF